MNKYEAIYSFWSSFGVPAYEARSVPDGADAPRFPYITFTADADVFGRPVSQNASVWTRSESWTEANAISDAITEKIGLGGCMIAYDGGGLWIRRGAPFCQNLGDENDDKIKRKYILTETEFISMR